MCVPNPYKDTFRRIDFNDPNVFFSVEHINDALYFPNTTIPPAKSKLIPGLRSSGNVLSRAVEQKSIDANRNKSQRACKQYDPNYAVAAQQNLQCDEYPFASTYQGAASNIFDFSVREIPGPDNDTAGSYLRAFYQTFRIADGDPFWVELRKDPQ
ncbi:NucA/NucB deoxyribonuclease domain-containing protein [Intrasporangium sp. YIM S08009]|uniref:NucA/NucB deoxyribonuclease domain-containing protein n=1 Tax=Intrasporangium zincisolvens TaxID=3080018 RepID=UPI002B0546D1|nr:NucA/NucB deoxyribonuclease domain-containing protein [Intrasporangium sp. YIM S08009]